jgi:hypothetical protein
MSVSSVGASAPHPHHASPKTENAHKEPPKPEHHEVKRAAPAKHHKVDVKA